MFIFTIPYLQEIDEQVLKTQVLNETVDETKRNDKFITDKPIESDNLVVQTEKTRPLQIGDLFPSINEILNDHGIKEKFRGMLIELLISVELIRVNQSISLNHLRLI